MTLTKKVNGEEVTLSLEEEQDFISNQRSLNSVKRSKIDEVEEKLKIFLYKPVAYLGTSFIASEVAGNNLIAAHSYGTDPINWLDKDGVSIELTKAQILDLINLIMTQRSSGYFQESSLKSQINNCSTIEQLESIDINFY